MAESGLSAGRRRLARVRMAGAARIGLELPLTVERRSQMGDQTESVRSH